MLKMTAFLGIVMAGIFASSIHTVAQSITVSPGEAREMAKDAYIYGWPLLCSEATAGVMTAVASPQPTAFAPFNQLGRRAGTVKAGFTTVVTVNTEVLFISGFLDLSQEPMIFSAPDMGNRYWIGQLQDWWSENVDPVGTRLTGNKAQHVAIVGPDWQGKLPEGVLERRLETKNVWLISRIRVRSDDPQDIAAGQALAAQMRLTPLSVFGDKGWTPPATVAVKPPLGTEAPVEQVVKMDGDTFFRRMADAMMKNPPHQIDGEMIKRLARIGLIPGQPFDPAKLQPEVREAINQAVADARKALLAAAGKGWSDRMQDGWSIPVTKGNAVPGRFQKDYHLRAVIAYAAFAVNRPEDAIYFNVRVDKSGAPLTGEKRYTLTFPTGELPPVDEAGFWSLTLYDNKQFLVDNTLDRYALVGDTPFVKNADESITLSIQSEDPGDAKRANWLPAPAKGEFNLALRLYIPKERVLNDRWTPPAIEQVQ